MNTFKLKIFLFFFISGQVLANTNVISNKLIDLAYKIRESSYVGVSDGDHLISAVNIRINECESFPYYNQDGSSTEKLIESLSGGIAQLGQCFEGKESKMSSYLNGKINDYLEIMNDKGLEKYITCDAGDANSYVAIATESENSNALTRYPRIKQYPGMIINTNRVSGNFPLGMDEQAILNSYNFYGGRIAIEDIVSGKINPLYNYITNPTSLVIHESLHWTSTSHFNKEYPDIVYLAQACCFEQSGIDNETKETACQALFDLDMYDKDRESRKKAQKVFGVSELVKKINKDLHNVSNQGR